MFEKQKTTLQTRTILQTKVTDNLRACDVYQLPEFVQESTNFSSNCMASYGFCAVVALCAGSTEHLITVTFAPICTFALQSMISTLINLKLSNSIAARDIANAQQSPVSCCFDMSDNRLWQQRCPGQDNAGNLRQDDQWYSDATYIGGCNSRAFLDSVCRCCCLVSEDSPYRQSIQLT